ncbi:MAG: exosortase T [Pseudomonadota bacterium]
MDRTQNNSKTQNVLCYLGLATASAILAAEPFLWLVESWRDPAYQSSGQWYALGILGLIAASWRSGPAAGRIGGDTVFAILAVAAILRLSGQVLAVNILAALALAVDVYGIAVWLGLARRRFALSPVWLAALFLFALPLAPILERVLGFPLQMISAAIGCALLTPWFADLDCGGVRLRLDGTDILVDLPCSGTTGLLLLLGLWTFLNAIHRPRPGAALLGLIGVLAAALIGNGLRIGLLAGGLARGIDTMAPVPHQSIGLATLALSAMAVLAFYRPAAGPPRRARPAPLTLPPRARLPAAILAVAAAMLIVDTHEQPLDRSGPITAAALPDSLLGHSKTALPLSDIEQVYFTAYGGQAQKAVYGPFGMNVVQTGAPLRHLHAPETCLRGMGYRVRFLGTRFDPIPTSIYHATAPDGREWLVEASFVSDRGDVAAGVGEAVWSWLRGRSASWSSVQRITPVSLSPASRSAFERAALTALDI